MALLVLWPSDDAEETARDEASEVAVNAAGAEGANPARAGRGGVAARRVDDARRPAAPRRNPAVQLPPVGLAPAVPPDEEPPEFSSKAEAIAWYEKKLEQAIKMREARKKFADRLPEIEARIKKGPNPESRLETFEQRRKVVEDNYEAARKHVEELEKKLAELRG